MAHPPKTAGGEVPRAYRFVAGLPALLHYEDEDWPCVAHNLSRSGLLLLGDLPLPDEPDVEVTVRSASGDLELRTMARTMRIVEYVDDDGEGPLIEIGLEFERVVGRDHEMLESLIARVIEGIAPAILEQLPSDASPEQIREALGMVPLVHRAMMAQRAQAPERALLMHDPNPQVLEGLSRNPQLNLTELRNILRQRKLMPRTLQHLASASRWTAQEETRIMIACHPETPLHVADRLLASLTPTGLERAIRTPGLNPALRLKLGAKVRGPGRR